jgi:hypothetical protein
VQETQFPAVAAGVAKLLETARQARRPVHDLGDVGKRPSRPGLTVRWWNAPSNGGFIFRRHAPGESGRTALFPSSARGAFIAHQAPVREPIHDNGRGLGASSVNRQPQHAERPAVRLPPWKTKAPTRISSSGPPSPRRRGSGRAGLRPRCRVSRISDMPVNGFYYARGRRAIARCPVPPMPVRRSMCCGVSFPKR